MIALIFLIAALVCFVLAAIGAPSGRINLTAAGLACYAAAQLVLRA
jgi:hypothetical protein